MTPLAWMQAVQQAHGITGTPRAVLWAMASHAGADGACWASRRTIALEAGVSEASVKRAWSLMASVGWVDREERVGETDRFILRPDRWPMAQREGGVTLTRGRGHTDPTGGVTLTPGGVHSDPGEGSQGPGGGVSVHPKPAIEPASEPVRENGALPSALLTAAKSIVEVTEPGALRWSGLRQQQDVAHARRLWDAMLAAEPGLTVAAWSERVASVVDWLRTSPDAAWWRDHPASLRPKTVLDPDRFAGFEADATAAPPVDDATARALRLLDCVLADDYGDRRPEAIRQAREAALRLGGPDGIRRRLDDRHRHDVAHELWAALGDVTGGAA